jgi:cell wall-associated NlpC family hydrolase
MREKDIVAAARDYIGVPFVHQGRSRFGLDCLGLLVRVAHDCDLRLNGAPLWLRDEGGYGHYPDADYLRAQLEAVLQPAKTLFAGGVVLMRHDCTARHLGVVGDYAAGGGLSLIHAYAPAKAVVEHRLDDEWRARIVAKWRF